MGEKAWQTSGDNVKAQRMNAPTILGRTVLMKRKLIMGQEDRNERFWIGFYTGYVVGFALILSTIIVISALGW